MFLPVELIDKILSFNMKESFISPILVEEIENMRQHRITHFWAAVIDRKYPYICPSEEYEANIKFLQESSCRFIGLATYEIHFNIDRIEDVFRGGIYGKLLIMKRHETPEFKALYDLEF